MTDAHVRLPLALLPRLLLFPSNNPFWVSR
jgi:hypothetical protein